MEGLVGENKPQKFFIFFAPTPPPPPACVSSHLRTLPTQSFPFLATQPKSRFEKLSILIEIINPFYSFPDFHFVRSIIEEKGYWKLNVHSAQWHLE